MKKKSCCSILQSGEDYTSAVPSIPVDELRHPGGDVSAGMRDHRCGDRRRCGVENVRRRRRDVRKHNLFLFRVDVEFRGRKYAEIISAVSRSRVTQVPPA